jgi:hypothetical protein
MALQALWLLFPDPLPPPDPLPLPDPLPDPLPEPDPVPLPDPLDEDENVEPAAPPPQFAQLSANASKAAAADRFFPENFILLFSQERVANPCAVRPCRGRNRDMYYQHLAENYLKRVIPYSGNPRLYSGGK